MRHPNHRPVEGLPRGLGRQGAPRAAIAWVERQLVGTVARVERLTGASSAVLHRLDLADGRRVVLRRWAWLALLDDEPHLPRQEVDVVRFITARGTVPVPAVVAVDLDGSAVGDGVPSVVMTLAPGRPLAAPDPRRLAEVAASLHAIAADDLGYEWYAWYEDEMVTPLQGAVNPALWERAIEIWRTSVPSYRPRLIHRDFHPGNVLWSRGHATAVVDWCNGCRGPIGCDLATCWSNLAHWAGQKVADDFVAAYTSLTGEQLDPFWRLANLLESGPDYWASATNVRGGEDRIQRLLADLQ